MALPPGARLTAAGLLAVVAAASPPATTEGGVGEGRTLVAVTPPVFRITTVAVNPCPREIRVVERVSDSADSRAGRATTTVVEAGAAVTLAPVIASTPLAPAVKVNEPVSVPFST